MGGGRRESHFFSERAKIEAENGSFAGRYGASSTYSHSLTHPDAQSLITHAFVSHSIASLSTWRHSTSRQTGAHDDRERSRDLCGVPLRGYAALIHVTGTVSAARRCDYRARPRPRARLQHGSDICPSKFKAGSYRSTPMARHAPLGRRHKAYRCDMQRCERRRPQRRGSYRSTV